MVLLLIADEVCDGYYTHWQNYIAMMFRSCVYSFLSQSASVVVPARGATQTGVRGFGKYSINGGMASYTFISLIRQL